MKVDICKTYEELSQKAKDSIIQEIEKKKDLLFCAATGGSPTETYRLLGKEHLRQPSLFAELRILKLDEWGGIPMSDNGTCESYMQAHLLQPLQISESRYIGFHSCPDDPLKECMNIQRKLDKEGPIDLCILGLGMNCHLALNEPAEYLQPYCHKVELSGQSLRHPMTYEMQIKPAYGLTLGMADIFCSKMILILIHGQQKKKMVSQFLSKKITSSIPASFLWLHPNVICLIEKDSLDEPGIPL